MKKFGRIILWILFWYYLIPYYLLKKFIFHGKYRIVWSGLGSIVVLFILLIIIGINTPDDEETNTTSGPKIHYVVKKVGKSELASAQAKNKVLKAQITKKEAEYKKLKDELSSQQEKQKEEKAQKQKIKQKAAKEEIKKEHQTSKKQETEESNSSSNTDDSNSDSGNGAGRSGDMNTADSGKIVGNRNTHIYHVPGQAGYKMNSANAVYFDSEQDAINAGYRKAKR